MAWSGIIEADPRHTTRRMRTAMQGDVIRALIELITNRHVSASLTSNQETATTFGAGRAGLLAAFQAV